MKSKILSVAVSLLCAFGLWLYVVNIVSPGSEETYYNIPMVLDGESVLAERGLMVTNVSVNKVNLRLSGSRLDLSKVDSSNITIKADLSGIYEPGSRIPLTYSITYPGELTASSFQVMYRSPERVYVTVEKRISKSVPVEINWQGTAAEGFLADRKNREQEYETIQITGPAAVVDSIEKAVIPIDLTGLRESISQEFMFTLCDGEGEPVDAGLITANVSAVRISIRIQRVKDVKLVCHLVEGGGATAENAQITLSQDSIRVSGSEAAIEQMGDELVIGTIYLGEITEDTDKTFVIPLEEGITNLTGVLEVTAQIRLQGLNTRDFLVSGLIPENIPEGLEADLITRELLIHVRGDAELLEKLRAEDIRVTVDLSDGEAGGTASYAAKVTFAPGFESLGTVLDGTVFVSFWEKTEETVG